VHSQVKGISVNSSSLWSDDRALYTLKWEVLGQIYPVPWKCGYAKEFCWLNKHLKEYLNFLT